MISTAFGGPSSSETGESNADVPCSCRGAVPSAPVLCCAPVLQHRVTTTYRYERPPRRERQQPAGRKIVVCVTARAPLPGGFLFPVQDDLVLASGILIGVSIGMWMGGGDLHCLGFTLRCSNGHGSRQRAGRPRSAIGAATARVPVTERRQVDEPFSRVPEWSLRIERARCGEAADGQWEATWCAGSRKPSWRDGPREMRRPRRQGGAAVASRASAAGRCGGSLLRGGLRDCVRGRPASRDGAAPPCRNTSEAASPVAAARRVRVR